MNATNRILNRIVLLVTGLILAAAGAAAILTQLTVPWAENLVATVMGEIGTGAAVVDDWTADILAGTAVTDTVTGTALIALVLGLLLLVLLIVFLGSRGGGKIPTVLRVKSDDGRTEVDQDVVEAVLARPLHQRQDVLTAHTGVFRVKGAPAIRLSMTLRRGASLDRVLRTVDAAVAEWDELAGREIPVVLHLTGRGLRERWRGATRVQ